MALLMVVAPTLALLRLLLSRPDQEDDRS
jgi:hypothetical protein